MSDEATIKPKPLPNTKGPKFVKYFRPALEALHDLGGSATSHEVYRWISENYDAPKVETDSLTKDGIPKFEKYVAFARFWLVRMGVLENKKRGIWTLSGEKNEEFLSDEYLYNSYMKSQRDYTAQYKKLKQLQKQNAKSFDESEDSDDEDENSDHSSEQEFLNQNQIRGDLVTLLQKMSPSGFERFCALFLRNIGFESITVTGRSGDQGIDGEGFYRINRLIHDKMMFQCKRYINNSVGPGEIRDFRGGIMGRAGRGVFLTTGNFTKSAEEEASRENAIPIELVDIDRLLELIIEEQLGVEEVKALKIDADFFEPYLPEE